MPVYTSTPGGGGGGGTAYRTQWEVLYDVTNDQYFLRQYAVNAGDSVTGTSDFELDGTTVYVPSANVRDLRDSQLDVELLEKLDVQTNGTVVVFYRRNLYVNGALSASITTDSAGALYTVTGTEKDPTQQYEQVDTYYLDVTDAAVQAITDAEASIGGGVLGAIPNDVCSASIRVEVTSLDGDGLPSGFLFVTSDAGSTPGSAATPGDKVFNKDTILLGEAGESQGDPLEISNFRVIADTGETARLVVKLYRRR